MGSRRGARSDAPETSSKSVQEILAEYEAYLPLTIRQVFCRLVGNYVAGRSNWPE